MEKKKKKKISKRKRDKQEKWRQKKMTELLNLLSPVDKTLKKKKRRHTAVINDQPMGEDYLNYTDYASAFGSMLSDKNIALPITVGIYASWGSGKSFLLGKIKEYIEININAQIKEERRKLKRKCVCDTRNKRHEIGYEYIIIDFNAWSYNFSDVLWAGLVKEIHTKVEERYGFLSMRFFRFFVYPFRSNSKQKMFCMITYAILRFLFLIIFSILLGAVLTEDAFINIFGEVAIYSAFGITIATILPSIIQLIITLCKDKGTEIMKSAKNISEQVGFMGDVRHELELICDFVKMKRAKFAVFIDDLDRCQPNKIVDMLDATMLLLSNLNYPFLTFVTIDPRIIVKSIESVYDDIFQNCGITGFEYLDKLIQIPFSIPIASPATKDNIIRILTREKEDVLNIVFDLCIFLIKKHMCFMELRIKEFPDKAIYEIDRHKLSYNHKIQYIKDVYSNIKSEYGSCLGSKYLYEINDTSSILSFLLKILRHLKSNCEAIRNKPHKIEINIRNELVDFLSTKQNILDENEVGELKNVIISNAEDGMEKYVLPPNMTNVLKLIKDGKGSDVNYKELGIFLQNKKNSESQMGLVDNLNKLVYDYYKLLKKFMSTKEVRFSPLNDELNTLCLNFEKITRTLETSNKTLYAHSQSMLSKEEVRYFHEISSYFDGNCRRNKRIINVYVLIKNLLGERIVGWYKSTPVTMYTLKILIKIVILFEQWPYRMCAIFQILEDYKERLIKLPGESNIYMSGETSDGDGDGDLENQLPEKKGKKDIDDIDEWFEAHRFTTLQIAYENLPAYLVNNECIKMMRCVDYNKILFSKFLDMQPIITVEYFYICISYIFNINYSIKNMISKIINNQSSSNFKLTE
jgi:hypothetical protein